MDSNYKANMTKVAAKEFLKNCISLAVFRDGSSGGCMRILDITKDKVEREFLPYS